MKSSKAFEATGWLGVVLILGAYAALSFGYIAADYAFQLPSCVGSLLVAAVSWAKRDRQASILNVVFAVIAMLAMIRLSILH